ncbi:MAG: hypothetical protein DRN81_01115 [Thermoproteota archaeon]|nr:MAG: hypothetical protein DRN81_01115 [Candidatus Korarchaeota archaeon]
MAESMDRELGQIQQKLENTSDNLGKVSSDLGRLFTTIDKESKNTLKEIARLEEKINIHGTTSHAEKQSIRDDIIYLKNKAEQNRKDIDAEKDKRVVFETDVKAGVRFAKIISTVLGAAASLISAIAALMVHFKG